MRHVGRGIGTQVPLSLQSGNWWEAAIRELVGMTHQTRALELRLESKQSIDCMRSKPCAP